MLKQPAPIILFVYNRPHHTQRMIEALKKNVLSETSKLFIYSDGAKKEDHVESVQNVRKLIKSVRGFLNVEIVERDTNLGLANSIITGVDEVLAVYGNAIILEDDLIVSPFFLNYMNQGLEIYEPNAEVASIHGYIYPVNTDLPQSFFLRGADCWGWATWHRAWNTFERSADTLIKNLSMGNLISLFDYNNTVGNFKMLKKQSEGKIDSWAIRWHASCFINKMYTLYPGKSLVSNIGNDNSGTHTTSSSVYDVSVAKSFVELEKIEISENENIRQEIEKYFESIKQNTFQKLLQKIFKQ